MKGRTKETKIDHPLELNIPKCDPPKHSKVPKIKLPSSKSRSKNLPNPNPGPTKFRTPVLNPQLHKSPPYLVSHPLISNQSDWMRSTTEHILYPTPLLDLSPERPNQINQRKLQSKTLQTQTAKDDSGRVGFTWNGSTTSRRDFPTFIGISSSIIKLQVNMSEEWRMKDNEISTTRE
jgi:hypothetical protein